MVDENGRQTITNDGATVMKVRTTPAPALHMHMHMHMHVASNKKLRR